MPAEAKSQVDVPPAGVRIVSAPDGFALRGLESGREYRVGDEIGVDDQWLVPVWTSPKPAPASIIVSKE